MDFITLQNSVNSAMGRTDVPAYVYTLTTAGVNRDMRLLDMEASTTLTGAGPTIALPSDFGSVQSLYVTIGGSAREMEAVDDHAAVMYTPTGAPRRYSIRDGSLYVGPSLDGEYTFDLNYFKDLAAFAADSDTNAVIARYPDLYVYQALMHAAVWAKDTEEANNYANLYRAAMERAEADDRRRRFGTRIVSRSARVL